MSSAEIIGARAITSGERMEAKAESVQEAVASPARPADAELTLRSMEVYVPTEAVNINGQLFSVSIDQAKLAKAVNTVAESTSTNAAHDLYPRQLVIDVSLGQSTVAIGEDLQPKTTNPNEDDTTPTLTTFEDGGTSVNITLPSELVSTDYSEAGLIELVNRQANKDLLVALGQNLEAKRKFHFGLRIAGLVVAMGTGEGLGIALSDKWLDMLERGTLGVLAGGILGVSSILAADKFRGRDPDNFRTWAVKKSRDYQGIHWGLKKIAKEGPIISLNAVQAEQSDAS